MKNILTKEVRDQSGAILQYDNVIIRVPDSLAKLQVERGKATYTSKSKLKRMVKFQARIDRNKELLTRNGVAITSTNTKVNASNGKVQIHIRDRKYSISGHAYPLNVGLAKRQLPI